MGILLGRKFVIETDHANLKWSCSIAPHKASWASLLAEYDFDLCHRPGYTNIVPDRVTQFHSNPNPKKMVVYLLLSLAHCHPWLSPFTWPAH